VCEREEGLCACIALLHSPLSFSFFFFFFFSSLFLKDAELVEARAAVEADRAALEEEKRLMADTYTFQKQKVRQTHSLCPSLLSLSLPLNC
jgi:hypothetical protein